MPGKPLGIRPGAREWAGNTAVLLTKASLKPRSVQDTQDETSRPCSVGHTDGDANDDTLFSGEMPGAVRASCVILMEPHEPGLPGALLGPGSRTLHPECRSRARRLRPQHASSARSNAAPRGGDRPGWD
ncbi:hypothetical protein R6Z07M_009268 [Ovis aries]